MSKAIIIMALTISSMAFYRMRGDSFDLAPWMNKTIEAMTAGLMLMAIMLVNGMVLDYYSVLIPVAFALGAAPGWSMIGEYIRGEKTSPEPEWYQIGDLANNPTLSIIVRSFIFSAPSLSLGYLSGDPHIISLGGALFLSFCLSVFTTQDWVKAEFALPMYTTVFYLIIKSGM